MRKVTPRISSVPSRAIYQALRDLEWVERSKRFTVEMGLWFEPEAHGRCCVCLAGAVLAHAGNSAKLDLCPSNFNKQTARRLCGLDCFRSGALAAGLEEFGRAVPNHLPSYIDIVEYEDDPWLFKQQLRALADLLKANKL